MKFSLLEFRGQKKHTSFVVFSANSPKWRHSAPCVCCSSVPCLTSGSVVLMRADLLQKTISCVLFVLLLIGERSVQAAAEVHGSV